MRGEPKPSRPCTCDPSAASSRTSDQPATASTFPSGEAANALIAGATLYFAGSVGGGGPGAA